MKTSKQITIDQYIAKPIAYLMNFLVRIAGKILSIDHRLDRDFKRIVICKFKGMGSIIQSTPMLAALRKKFPNARIIYVSTESNARLLQRIDFIDQVITINDKNLWCLISTLAASMWRLIRLRPDVYIDLEIYSNFSTLVTLFSLSRNRIGFYLRSSSFRMGIYTHMMFFNSKVPISEVYLQIARLFGPIDSLEGLYPIYKDIQVDPTLIPSQGYIVVNINASDLRIERRWSAANFKLLIGQIVSRYPDKEIILIGSPSEAEYTRQLHETVPYEKVKNRAGKTSIEQLIALIHHAELVITNDTGPMHIAFACQTPAICLFGPCSPQQYGGVANARILYKKVYCSPCVHDFSTPPCKGNNVCMQLIEVQEVMKTITDFFDQTRSIDNGWNETGRIYYEVGKQALGLVRRDSYRSLTFPSDSN